jgi:hypothetical protein
MRGRKRPSRQRRNTRFAWPDPRTPATHTSVSTTMFTEQMIAYMQSNSKLSTASPLRAGRAELAGVGVLLESTRIYNFKAFPGITGSFVAQLKCQNAIIYSNLRCLEYSSSNQVVGGSDPSGRTKINGLEARFLGAVLLARSNSTMNFPASCAIRFPSEACPRLEPTLHPSRARA